MIVQVLYQTRNTYTGEVEGFDHIANVEAPEHYDAERAMEYAFRRLQNIEGSWSMDVMIDIDGFMTKNPDYSAFVEVVAPLRIWSDGRVMGHRSCSMYDRMIVDGKTYEVDCIGFREIA